QHEFIRGLNARDDEDVTAPPYRDFERPPDGTRNEELIADYSRELADRVSAAGANGEFVLVLGGDCSIVLGNLLGVRQGGRRRVGWAYIDAHADVAAPHESGTGSASSMCLADAVGRNHTVLAGLTSDGPLVAEEDVVMVGRYVDADEPAEAK